MARKTALDQFAQTFEIDFNQPAKPTELTGLAEKFSLTLPQELRDLYQRADGGNSSGDLSQLELLPLKTVRKYPASLFKSPFGYFPTAENNDSNPVCVCCKGPLTGYVVLVCHDDEPRLLCRTLDDFYRSAVKYAKQHGELDTYELPSDFDSSRRTDRDLAAASELVQLASSKKRKTASDTDTVRFACDLFSDKQVDEIIALLDIADPGAREHVVARLSRIRSPKAKKALAETGGSFDDFVEAAAALLSKAGLSVSVHNLYGKNTIRVDKPKAIWLNMDAFFKDRQRPDFNDTFVTRITQLTGKKKPSK